MICVSDACKQHSGRCPTPWTCGGYATEAHHDAMTRPLYAPLREVPIVITMDDEPMPTPESAMHLAKRLGGVALLIAAVGAAWGAAVYLDPGPWLAAWLAF